MHLMFTTWVKYKTQLICTANCKWKCQPSLNFTWQECMSKQMSSGQVCELCVCNFSFFKWRSALVWSFDLRRISTVTVCMYNKWAAIASINKEIMKNVSLKTLTFIQHNVQQGGHHNKTFMSSSVRLGMVRLCAKCLRYMLTKTKHADVGKV